MRSLTRALALWTMALVLGGGPAWAGSEPSIDAPPTTQPAIPPAQNNQLEHDRRIGLNFQDADIDQVLAYLSRAAGVTFLKYTQVLGEVTIVVQRELTVAEAFHVLNAVLKAKGATCIVNESKFVKIVPLSDARKYDGPVYFGTDPSALPRAETIITCVVPLKRARARELARDLRNLVGVYGDLSAGVQGNCLIITDTANNVRRLLNIVSMADIDPEAHAEIRVFKLTHANADDIANVLKQMFPQQRQQQTTTPRTVLQFRGRTFGRGASTAPTPSPSEESEGSATAVALRVTVDKRLNAVVVIAGTEQMPQIERLILELDVPPDAPLSVVEIVRMEHGDCEEVAKALRELFQARSTGRAGSRTAPTTPQPFWRRSRSDTSQPSDAEAGPATDELLITTDRRTNTIILVGTREQVEVAKEVIERLSADAGEQMDMLLIPLKNAKARDLERALRRMFQEANRAAQRLQPSTGRSGQQTAMQAGAPGIAGETVIVADEAANALLVVSNPRNFDRIKEYVAQLDQAKPQVYIQALIGEITLDDDFQLGVDFSYIDEPLIQGRGSGVLRMDFGVSADLTGGSVTVDYRDIQLVIRALETEGKLNVLSRPHILTLDNQVARIADAERVPFIRSTRATEEGTVFNTIQYEDIGIILQVTPQINQDGYVNMLVEQEISRVTGRTVPISEGVDAPTFSTRSARTTVSIHDGQTIIIGGLIAESEVSTIEEVPLLGQLPLIGYVFRKTVTTTQRKELVLILTPRVIRTDEQLRALSDLQRAESSFRGAAGGAGGAEPEPPAPSAASSVDK